MIITIIYTKIILTGTDYIAKYNDFKSISLILMHASKTIILPRYIQLTYNVVIYFILVVIRCSNFSNNCVAWEILFNRQPDTPLNKKIYANLK